MNRVRNDPQSIFKQREESFRLHPRLDQQTLLTGPAFSNKSGKVHKRHKTNQKAQEVCAFFVIPLVPFVVRSALGRATWRLKYFRKVKRHDRVRSEERRVGKECRSRR